MWDRMVGNPRSELASGSTEGHCNGHRASYSSATLERSGSFRESIDSRVLSSGASNRTTSQVAPAEIPPPSQFLLLDFLSLGDQKYPRSGELRRAVGVSLEDHSFVAIQPKNLTPAAAEELKRFKASVLETNLKARDRARLLQDSIAKLDRYRGLVSRKRQRSEIPSSEKPGSGNITKMGSQLHQAPSDPLAQRLEERTKSLLPNKRMRTSVAEIRADGRGTIPQSKDKNAPIDKDKNMLRACNGLMPVEEKIRVLPGGEGWDRKMKRKRSVGPAVTRPMDGDREFKTLSQQRLSAEPRVRPNDGLSFRQASSGGVIGTLKSENSPQLNVTGNRPISRVDFDNASLTNDRRERGLVAKGGNKSNIREDTQMGSQSPLTKGKASRGPRTGSSVIMNSSSGFQRSSAGIDGWDQASCVNKIPYLSGANNRKNSLPSVSTSPPMAQWGNQRLPKNTRTRRTNLLPPTPNQESPAIAEGVSSEVSRSYQKPKLDGVLSPPTASESEESAAVETRYKERVLHNSDMEDGDVGALQKATSSLLPLKKNKPLRDEMGNGARRPGRSGRGSTNQKAGAQSSKEKLESSDAARPMRVGRPGSDISKGGRPPSKKTSERKSYGRPSLALNNCSSEITGDQDDDHNELLLAADYARKAIDQSCSSLFWKSMEEVFSFTNEEPTCYLKQQINLLEEVDEGTSDKEALSGKHKWIQNSFPLSQRLLSAFIEEDEDTSQATTGPVSDYDPELTFDGRSSCNGYSNSEMDISCSAFEFQHTQRCLDDKIAAELQNLGLLVDTVPGLMDGDKNEVDKLIAGFRGELYDQMKIKKTRLLLLDQAIQKTKEADERRLEKMAMDKLVEMAFKRHLGGRSQKSGVNRMSKQASLSFAKRVLERCRKYEATGVSCFRELLFSESKTVDQGQGPDVGPSSEPEQPVRAKKREVLLDDVAGVSPSCRTGGSNPFAGGAKGKRSEIRNPKARPGGPRGERKTKVKPKQRTVQPSPPRSGNLENPSRETDTAVGFPNLSLESIEGLDVQGQDIGSWLNVEDEALLDNDLMMGLEIPMDDLSEINMNF